jgi:hypothetical protein
MFALHFLDHDAMRVASAVTANVTIARKARAQVNALSTVPLQSCVPYDLRSTDRGVCDSSLPRYASRFSRQS